LRLEVVDPPCMECLGDRIRIRRRELRWTLATLSEKSKVSKGFLSDLENGNKKTAGGDYLQRIATALGIGTGFLISGGYPLADSPIELQIPGPLAKFAQQESLSFAHTAMLLQLRKQILAFRSNVKSDDLEDFDWKPFYEAVKDHLK